MGILGALGMRSSLVRVPTGRPSPRRSRKPTSWDKRDDQSGFCHHCGTDIAKESAVHVRRERMTCKFWLEPMELATNHGFSARELNQIRAIIERELSKIKEAWSEHCGQR